MAVPIIDRYRFGEIVSDGRRYTADVIICADRVISNWRRQQGHVLMPADLVEVLAVTPAMLVVGQGRFGLMRVPAETRRRLAEAGIELVAQPTGQAYITYNRLCAERLVVAAVHLAC